MNYGDLQTEFYSSGFSYLQSETNGPARVGRWINQAYQELCDLDDWPFLEASTTQAAPITIADLAQVLDVIDTTTKTTLIQTDHRALTTNVSDLTLAGSPIYYYITGGTVVNVWPTNTSDQVTVRYYKNPTDLSNNSDTPIVPAAFHDVIVLGAWRRGLLDDSAAGDYQMVIAEYERRLQVMRDSQLVIPQYQTLTGASTDG